MREIKFRAWDGQKIHEDVTPWRWDFVISNSWHRCEKSTGSGFLGNGGDYAEMLVPAVRFKELMQYTGLKDMNGKKIYEGDIVKDTEEVYTVEFGSSDFLEYTGYGWILCNKKIRFFISPEDCPLLEIIGNIYENPEMLNRTPNDAVVTQQAPNIDAKAHQNIFRLLRLRL